jgi:hypothetical protein
MAFFQKLFKKGLKKSDEPGDFAGLNNHLEIE